MKYSVVTEYNIAMVCKYDPNTVLGCYFSNSLPDFETILIYGFVMQHTRPTLLVKIKQALKNV